jgi:polysaccharide export outer membrane protein
MGITIFMSTLRHCHAVAVLMLGACVTFVVQAAESAAPAAAASAATDAPPANNETYIIGPGDQLQLFVWRNPELSANIPVRPDGKISTPLVPDMVAVGKTPTELAKDLEKVLAEYIRSPQVNVIVAQPASVFSQVRVIGQVAKPQAVAFRQGMSVLDVVLAVGGLAPFAAGNRSKIIRKVDGKEREIKVKLADLVNKGDMKQNVPMLPGDVLVVPESRF